MGEWMLPVVAVLLIGHGAVSARLATTVITQAMVFVALGLLIGNRALDVVDLEAANQFVRHLAEATLALVLFTDAVRIDLGRLRREALVPARLLGAGLPLTIVAGTAAGLALLPDLTFWTAAALAIVLAPTDAALGLPVVSNPRLPSRIRQGLNVESGLNDGVCVPLLIICLTIAEAEEGAAHIEPVRVILEEIGFGALGGVVAGVAGAFAVRSFAARGWMTPTWQQITAIATPLLAYTTASAVGGSGFIAAFVAGITYGVVAGATAEPTTALAEQSGTLFNAVTFLLFGAVLLGPAIGKLDWRIALYVLLSLTVVRMLPVALAMTGTGLRTVTVGFLGWFGPRGLASIVFVLLLVEQTDLPERPLMLTVVTWTVALSVLAHGLTALPGADRYADWYTARTENHPSMPETAPAASQRTTTKEPRQ
ncbi:cation:proton antiporter [Kribbella sp. CA-253562]|uniref:cation:proton antiporter n=1 Tax=Kribbella sp. CA-253562 TaxID=3239942 RepID=UPI003D8C00B1